MQLTLKTIDPFSDRTARDLRNSLSSALVRDLTAGGGEGVDSVADRWLAEAVAENYTQYVTERRHRYAQVLEDIRSRGLRDARLQAVMLWNAGLFFELHELLETIWTSAPEPARTALKGWIQAAGACLHLERGKPDAARGLARRARGHLAAGAASLSFIANLDDLIEALGRPGPFCLRLQIAAQPLSDPQGS